MTNPEKIICLSPSGPVDFAVRHAREIWARHRPDLTLEVSVRRDAADPAGTAGQGYRLRVAGTSVRIEGDDEAGAMYGVLDVADQVEAGTWRDTLADRDVAPRIEKRGIKFNIPLDARTPSYSDNGDSAQENIDTVWDMDFWRGFIDRMALDRFNVLTLWNMSPGPSLVRVPAFPDVALDDVMRASHAPNSDLRGMALYTPVQADSLVRLRRLSIDDKIRFWRGVMEYARERCVSVWLFTWNIYVYGTEHTRYGITDSAADPVTREYVRRTAEALVRTYPLLAGIGVTAGENMRKEWKTDVREDVEWIRDTYGAGIADALADEPGRDFTLIHRSHMTRLDQMEDVFRNFPGRFELSYKYSMAHLHSAVRPGFGDGFFAELRDTARDGRREGRKTWLTVRDDDFYLLRWADPGFARDYILNMPADCMAGFYLGSDGIVWARDFAPRDSARRGGYFWDRHAPSFRLWGRLAYDPAVPDTLFRGAAAARYGEAGPALYEALRLASHAITLHQRVFWHDYDFHWYPEACCSYLEAENTLVFRSIADFAAGRPCPGSGYMAIAEYADRLAAGTAVRPEEGIPPDAAAEEMDRECREALATLDAAEIGNDAEALELAADIRSLSTLGLYYAEKIRAALELCMARRTGEPARRETAVRHAETAAALWLAYSGPMAVRYRPQHLGRLRNTISPDRFDDYAQLDIRIAREG